MMPIHSRTTLKLYFQRKLDLFQVFLMERRLYSCDYCKNTGEGCDCGACGIANGRGYAWCMNNAGCPICKRSA